MADVQTFVFDVRSFHAPIESIDASAFSFPTPSAQSDGTAEWTKTTIVLVRISAAGATGVGFTYVDEAGAPFVNSVLAPALVRCDAFNSGRAMQLMRQAARNFGLNGFAMMAISAIDVALWDLRGKLLDAPLDALLGRTRSAAPLYGSGGFTSFDLDRLQDQLGGWAQAGFSAVKMKVGRDAQRDLSRMESVRSILPDDVALFVDANGAYQRKQALAVAQHLPGLGVTWFEEPVSSDDLSGLALLRNQAPGDVEVAAGEYGFDTVYFRRMVEADAVDVLQVDASRCGGVSGFMKACAVAEAFNLCVSSHCAPALHVHACCSAACLRHMEWFVDHVRVEEKVFDGVSRPSQGLLTPPDGPGLGLVIKEKDILPYRVA